MKNTKSKEGIKEYLGFDIPLEIYESVASTNLVAATRIGEGAAEWHTVVALSQSEGQGRLGRSFFSPHGTGLYMSTILYPDKEQTELITGCAAVCVCEAMEALGFAPGIKWVNDIIIDNKKVCGILAKGIHKGEKSAVILGIGINLFKPEGGFPEEISEIATYLFEKEEKGVFEKLLGEIIRGFKKRYEAAGRDDSLAQYRKRCITAGREVSVFPAGREGDSRKAHAISVDEGYHLTVEYEDGERESLLSGEVSVRI